MSMTLRRSLRVSKPQKGKGQAGPLLRRVILYCREESRQETNVLGSLILNCFSDFKTIIQPQVNLLAIRILCHHRTQVVAGDENCRIAGLQAHTRSDWLGPHHEPQNIDVIVPGLTLLSIITETCMSLNQTLFKASVPYTNQPTHPYPMSMIQAQPCGLALATESDLGFFVHPAFSPKTSLHKVPVPC